MARWIGSLAPAAVAALLAGSASGGQAELPSGGKPWASLAAPVLAANPRTVRRGATVTFTGKGFRPNARVTLLAGPPKSDLVDMLTLARTAAAVLPAIASSASGSAPAPIDCGLAKRLSRAPVRPVWFPLPQPAGYAFRVNADALPLFGGGLKWVAGRRYYWLARFPGGADLGDPDAKLVARPYLPGLGRHVAIVRLSRDGRLFAQWPTRGRYPDTTDTTGAVAKGESPARFTGFLRSLRRILWPTSCP